MKFLTAFFILVFGSYQPVHANDQPCADINGDGQVNITDFLILTEQYGSTTPCANATTRPQVVVVELKGTSKWNMEYHYVPIADNDEYPVTAKAILDVVVDLRDVDQMEDNGYHLIDFYVQRDDGADQFLKHYKPVDYEILKPHMRFDTQPYTMRITFYLQTSIIDHLRHTFNQGGGFYVYDPLPLTFYFVMIDRANIIKRNNSTD